MKKYLKFLVMAVGLFFLTACSGSSVSYSPEKCATLQQKIKDKEKLTDADYSEIIDQLDAILNVANEKSKEYGDDKEKEKEFTGSAEAREMLGYFLGFGMYLDSHHEELSQSNVKKLNKVMEKFKEEKEKL